MALKKSDLYSSLWSSADELRGSMDASQYKDYVLTLLFVKYVSDKAKADTSSLIYVPEDGSFDYLISLKGKPDVGEKVNIAIRRLADENDLLGVINNADFADTAKLGAGQEQKTKVSNLIGIFQDMDFSGSTAEGDDLLGDAYEYLMRHFATQSGKSKGQFYTPAEVSRVIAQLLQIPADTPKSTTVYDPTCGSGSLLIKVADAAPNGLSIYGQENDNDTWALARMNMFLHGYDTHVLSLGNTLANPKFTENGNLQRFDYLVANPPFSVKTWTNGFDWSYGRFDGFDSPPEKKGDYAFLLHMLKSMMPRGRGVVVLPHGVLFRGHSEARIRTELIKRGYIKAIIGLPANLFYGTPIPACLIVLDKADSQVRTGVFMMDASKGFAKDGPKNRLRARDMRKIVDTYTSGKAIKGYSRIVPVSEIADPENDYNLNIPRYIDSSESEDVQDLTAHVRGGIPDRDLEALQPYWAAFPSLRSELFAPLREGYSKLKVNPSEIPKLVTGSAEYEAFARGTTDAMLAWWRTKHDVLIRIDTKTKPAELNEELSEALLEVFQSRPLIDEYAVYEQFMSYWSDVMSDDVSLIVREGWTRAVQPRSARTWRDKKDKAQYEDADIVFGTGAKARRWVMDLLPPEYVVDRFFAEERRELERLIGVADTAKIAISEYIETHAVEDGLLFDAADEEGKLPKNAASDYLRSLRREGGDPDEIEALTEVITLYKAEAAAKKSVKDKATELDNITVAKYAELTECAVQQLVIDSKWGMAIRQRVGAEVANVGKILVSRLELLASRYNVKTREFKRQVMQDLLSGRSRLPGFTGEWVVRSIGSFATVKAGGTPSTSVSRYWGGDVPWMSSGEVHKKQVKDVEGRITTEGLRESSACLFPPHTVVLALAGQGKTRGTAAITRTELATNQSLAGIFPSLEHDSNFLYYNLDSRYDELRGASAGDGGRGGLNLSIIKDLEVLLPPVDEQCAIGQFLLDVDAEIEELELRLESVRAVKVATMQALLAGHTRLPIEEFT